jgi:crotonobetainyl-CoA:carnitine CoA-transferase CaiB-like acyl-CoA transferase
MTQAPLAHLKVVELCEDVAAAFCGRQFTTWGADVTVLEPENGSPLRRREPLIPGSDGAAASLLWENLAFGKRAMPLPDSHSLRDLIESADVFITDWPEERLQAAGLDPLRLVEANSGLVFVRVSPFGLDGPYAEHQATELVLQALSGFMSLNGQPDRPPLKAAGYLAQYAAGVSAFVGAMASLYERRDSGRGQTVEVSCLEAVTSLVPLLRTEFSGADAVRQNGPTSGTFMFECKDGFVALNPGAGRNWEDMLVALGASRDEVPEELRGDERPPALIRRFLEERLKQLPSRQVFHAFNELRISCGLAQSPLDLLDDRHLNERGFFREVSHPTLGTIRLPGPPFRMTAWDQGHTSPHEGERSRAATASASPSLPSPLSGLRVIDLTQAWLGPYATMLLGDLGAEIIKIESLSRPDSWRGAGTARRAPVPGPSAAHWTTRPANPYAHSLNTSGSFNAVNRSKRSLNLDLTTAEGREAFLGLVRDSDVVMENFTPRVMANFGLGYDFLKEIRPGLVLAAFSGYGASGPYRDYRANGATTDATCGWAYLVGYEDGPPTMMGIMEADPLTGLQMAASVLVALEARDETGCGYFIEGSMLEVGATYIGEEVLLASVTGQAPTRRGNRDRHMVPHAVFRCKGEDEWVAVAVRDDADWEALCAMMSSDAPAVADPKYQSAAARRKFEDEIEAAFAAWTVEHEAPEVAERLQRAGVPAAPVQPFSRVLEDQHLAARGWFQPMAHPDMGVHRYNGFPWRFSRTPAFVQCRPPRQGEHSVEILAERLGYAGEVIHGLITHGVTGSILVSEAVAEDNRRRFTPRGVA